MKYKNKTYKERYEELKTNIDVDTKINRHKNHYIHIPFSWAGICGFFALLGSIGLAFLNFLLLLRIGNDYKVWELLRASNPEEATHSFSQLIIIYPLIGEYLLIGLSIICLAALIKGGFKNLKEYNENGLIVCLIIGPIIGLILGPILGLILGLIIGQILGPILGLILGLIIGLILGPILGLIIGPINEFKK